MRKRGQVTTTKRSDPQTLIGKKFPSLQAWSGHNKTVVLALQVGCHFCSQSAPFYKKLLAYTSEHNIGVIALLPQSPAVGTAYVKDLGLEINTVGQSELANIDVGGTPTLFVVDQAGIVRKAWQGMLRDDQQVSVLSALN